MSADFLQCVESARHDRSENHFRTVTKEARRKRERCSEQMESNSRGTDNEKGNFRLIERFDSLHWVIAP